MLDPFSLLTNFHINELVHRHLPEGRMKAFFYIYHYEHRDFIIFEVFQFDGMAE